MRLFKRRQQRNREAMRALDVSLFQMYAAEIQTCNNIEELNAARDRYHARQVELGLRPADLSGEADPARQVRLGPGVLSDG